MMVEIPSRTNNRLVTVTAVGRTAFQRLEQETHRFLTTGVSIAIILTAVTFAAQAGHEYVLHTAMATGVSVGGVGAWTVGLHLLEQSAHISASSHLAGRRRRLTTEEDQNDIEDCRTVFLE